MFVVYDGGKKVEYHNGLSEGWGKSWFDKKEHAILYAKDWLGEYSITLPDNWDGSPINYSGTGDIIEIREE
jgi:hypothetical protein